LTLGTSRDRKLLGVLMNNVYQCTRDCDFSALFIATARFNHSCRPNAFVDATRKQAVVRALQDISEGEEVVTSYVPVSDSFDDRNGKLLSKAFTCTCARCKEEAAKGGDPLLAVPCRCGKHSFSVETAALPVQKCIGCGSSFNKEASMQNVQKTQEANTFMRTEEAKQKDVRELVNLLSPLAALSDPVATPNGATPPLHPETMELLNNLANCYFFCATNLSGDKRTDALAGFYECRGRHIKAHEKLHGTGTNQRDVSFLMNLNRVLHNEIGEFPCQDQKQSWAAMLSKACLLQFGRPSLPKGVSADLQ